MSELLRNEAQIAYANQVGSMLTDKEVLINAFFARDYSILLKALADEGVDIESFKNINELANYDYQRVDGPSQYASIAEGLLKICPDDKLDELERNIITNPEAFKGSKKTYNDLATLKQTIEEIKTKRSFSSIYHK